MPATRIALVGAPNTGKSTLFNRLVGRRKALVHSEPGMTRDINQEVCPLGDRQITLVDTGGLFPPGEEALATQVRRRVLEEAQRADVLVFLVDGKSGLTPLDEELATLFRQTGRPLIVAVNKIDVPSHEVRLTDFFRLGFELTVPLSAEHGIGVSELKDRILSLLPDDVLLEEEAEGPDEGGPVSLAIAGRPNVGKSSLFNALIGQDRAIVSDTPGTTRDSIDTLVTVGEHNYRILDTAGLRRKGHIDRGAESLSAMAARRGIEKADIVLIVMDSGEAPTMQDLHVAGVAQAASRPFVVLLNKWDLMSGNRTPEDLVNQVRGRLKFAPYAPIFTVSALTGLRVSRVLQTVDRVQVQSSRRLSTGRLNRWLAQAVAAHGPPSSSGRELKFHYIAQTAGAPPSFLLFTNRQGAPHFSYRRYLENSLRECFGLDVTPVILKYRKRSRTAGSSEVTFSKRR